MTHIYYKKQINEKAYTFAYILLILKAMLDSSELLHRSETFDTLIVYAFLLIIGYKLFIQTYDIKTIILIAIFAALYIYSTTKVDYYFLFFSYLCIIALQDVDIKSILKASIKFKLIFITIHVVAYIYMYMTNTEEITFIYRGGVLRHDFLLAHPNVFTAYLAWTSLEIIYVYYKKITKQQLVLIWFLNLGFYMFTKSNTGTITLTFVIFFIFIEKKEYNFINKTLSILSKYIYAIFSIGFPAIVIIYTRLNGILLVLWEKLNRALTGRLRFGAFAYDLYGLSLFGRTISFPEVSYWRGQWLDDIYFDNSYLWFFIIYGIIHLVILSVSFILIAKKTNRIEKVFIIAFALYGVMEHYIVNVAICFPLLFIGKHLMDSEKMKKLSIYS